MNDTADDSRSILAECCALTRWMDEHGLSYCKVPDASDQVVGGTPIRVSTVERLAGGKPGVPRYLVFTPTRRAPAIRGVAIEIVKNKRYMTREARAWVDTLRFCGWTVIIARCAEAAIKGLRQLGYRGAR